MYPTQNAARLTFHVFLYIFFYTKVASSSNALSVLRNVKSSDVFLNPYPHLIVKNCLPTEVYQELANTYPDYREIMRVKSIDRKAFNLRVDLNQVDIFSGKVHNVSKIWKEFVKYHSSQAFYNEVVGVFGDALNSYTKHHLRWLGKPFEQCKTGLRRVKGRSFTGTGCDFQLEVNVGVNTPTRGGTSTRGEHLDQYRELYAALLYFRENTDNSTGGALEILECKKLMCRVLSKTKQELLRQKVGGEVMFNPDDFNSVMKVEYEPNTLIFFLNGPISYHRVTMRSKSMFPRRLVNIIADRSNGRKCYSM